LFISIVQMRVVDTAYVPEYRIEHVGVGVIRARPAISVPVTLPVTVAECCSTGVDRPVMPSLAPKGPAPVLCVPAGMTAMDGAVPAAILVTVCSDRAVMTRFGAIPSGFGDSGERQRNQRGRE